jgi:S1-C subfamily serine protease
MREDLILKLTRIFAGAALALATLVAAPAPAQSFQDTARRIVEEKSDAVITIEVVSDIKMNFGARQQEQEERSEVLGTVIGENGLVVTALSSVDPSQIFERMSPGNDMGFSATVKNMKYILADNSEIEARVVLRDPDLDIAFLMPADELEEPLTAISLEDAAEPQILDRAFSIARMGRIARRTPVAMSGEIQGMVDRPRTFYIPSAEIVSGGTAVPVFAENGGLYGVVFLHAVSGQRGSGESVIPVVIPAEDIRESALQVESDTGDSGD